MILLLLGDRVTLGKPDYVKSVVLDLVEQNKVFEANQYLLSEERPPTLEEKEFEDYYRKRIEERLK